MSLPSVSDRIRRYARPPQPDDFTSPLHDERVVARVGSWVGVCLAVCFVTGLISHYQQHPVAWLPFGPDPAWGYRVTQGAHVVSGTLMLPLLLAKLFSAYPRLFTWPPIRGLVHALDRGIVGLLIAATVFQIATGLLNTAQWYPWHFGFVPTHFTVAWLAFGALLLHIAMKLPVITRAFGAPLADDDLPDDAEPPTYGRDPQGRTRRGFLLGVAAATAGVGLLTAGQTVYPLRRLALLAPRRPADGPQGLPVNRTATAAGVTTTAADPGWRLVLTGPAGQFFLSREDLARMPRYTHRLPIACVEGWSADAEWSGVRVSDLVAMAGGDRESDVDVTSSEVKGNYRLMSLPAAYARDPRTLLALGVNGEPLHLEHGAPARIIAPDRPGVLQTKWVAALKVVGAA